MNSDGASEHIVHGAGTGTLRIGYLINQYPKPSHTFIRTEMRELERQGHHVSRIAIRGWEEPAGYAIDKEEQSATAYVLKAGVRALAGSAIRQILTAPASFARGLNQAVRLGKRSQGGTLKHLIYLVEACWVVAWARRQGVTHLHAHFGTNTAVIAALVHALSSLSFSFTVHGPEEFDAPRELKLQEKAQAASFVVAITSFCRSQLFRWVDPQDWSKISIVRCTPSPIFLQTSPTPSPGNASLVCVGRLCEQKGQLTLISALRDVVDDGWDVSLVLAGDGPMRAEIECAIDAAQLRSRVKITGWVDSKRVQEELISADALVLPSFAEGLPIVIMEAMALGRPVLSTLIAGIPELVRDGEDGFLVPAGDSRLFADAIRQFLKLDPNERNRLAENCRTRVRTLHDPTREVAKLASLIGAAVANSSDSPGH